MFTGIVTAIGPVQSIAERASDLRIRIGCPWDPTKIDIGASIACSGVCLTVVERGGTAGDAWFEVDVSQETVRCTAESRWREGARLNLEQALKMGDELGGHIVTGHVDAVGEVADYSDLGGSHRLNIKAPRELAPFIAAKGSITVDGVSLTVNAVEDHADGSVTFTLNIIPHTSEVTTLGDLGEGSRVNLEIDMMARYLKRMQALAG
ncbi:riboflavin synthase [Qipengyuania atrilutea]|uniref:Riboflavin synthase n=1 Tax=Qipengyuania atrilutea TaxID=2744473 RepID=A0A850H0C6_9SPHN|nr:riboflavin synthase [Actirhodobacter atriluteus]NVD45341.1 riboflavin synthase [Actirhodobacter atriluteus]